MNGTLATSGSLAMDFVKTVSAGEVRARLESGRPFSALRVDGGVFTIDGTRACYQAIVEAELPIVSAVQAQMASGTHYGSCHALEVRWAEEVSRLGWEITPEEGALVYRAEDLPTPEAALPAAAP